MGMKTEPVEIVREFGPFFDCDSVGGVTFDGERAWFAAGARLQAFDPKSGALGAALPVAADAGTAFDGRYLYQLTSAVIQKVDPESGKVLSTIPAPGEGRDSGLTWAEGTLWVGEYSGRKIHQIDPETGRILRSIESDRYVTGVTWLDGELWHGTWESDESELRHIDASTGEVLERLTFPAGTGVSGLESDGKDTFFCGGGKSAKVRAVKRPTRAKR